MKNQVCSYCKKIFSPSPLGVIAAKHGFCSFFCLERGMKNPYETKEIIAVQRDETAASFRRGEYHPSASITEAVARDINKHIQSGMKTKDIAEKFGVHKRLVESIKYKRAWRHIHNGDDE